MPPHFMLQDAVGSLWAVLAFAPILYAPGYVVAYATDLFGFRRMDFALRSLWALACSFAVVPIAAHLVARGAGLGSVCWLVCGTAAITALLWLRRSDRAPWSRREQIMAALVACGWIAFALLMLVDVQAGRKLYFSVVMADQSYRIAFTDAVVRTGIPPANPLYFAGAPASMPYYYFWYLLCAVAVKLAHVSARQAFIASSIWAGFGLLTILQLYTREFFRWERRRRWIAMGLLLVGGGDLVPALGQALLQPSLNGDTEWWSVDPIDGWPDSLLWVPHHVAGVLCCLLAFLLLWRTLEPTGHSSRRTAVVLAAAAFASAVGLSVYVAFGFALLMAAWLVWIWSLRHPARGALWARTAIAAPLSTALLLPFLQELFVGLRHNGSVPAAAAATAPAPHLFSLSVRRMIDSELLTGLPLFTAWNRAHPVLLDQAIRLVLLLPGLAMELGVYGAVLVLLLVARRRGTGLANGAARDTALFFTISGLLITMFLSSSVITNNDFGYRAVMLPQFFLLLLTADLLGSWWTGTKADPVFSAPVLPTRRRRLWVGGLLWLGVAGTVYWAWLLRAWLPLEAARPGNGFSRSPEDEFQIREAFAGLDKVAPRQAVVAFRPIDPTPDRGTEVMMPNEFYQRMLVMDSGRQMLNAEGKCATHFGGDPRACAAIQTGTAQLYGSPVPTAGWARGYCARFGVQYLVLSAWDPSWKTEIGWPVTLPVVAAQPRLRILRCDTGAPTPGDEGRGVGPRTPEFR